MHECQKCGQQFHTVLMRDRHQETCTKSLKDPGAQEKFTPVFSTFGNQLLQELTRLHPMPVLLIGETGWGKSVLARAASDAKKQEYRAVNAHPGMDVAMLVGMWRPTAIKGGGVSVEWEDGLLTRSIKEGGTFLMEELTRAPQEAVSRFYGLLDAENRYWSMPEAGQEEVEVSPNFWFIGTANPPGGGYQASPVDRAMESRFAAIYEINQPIADETKILQGILGASMATKAVTFFADLRGKPESAACTREVVQWARLVKRGFLPKRASELVLGPKFPSQAKGIAALTVAHFS